MTSPTSGELLVETIREGVGPQARAGQIASVHYTGTLESGAKFDSSRDRGRPFEFELGAGHVIRGWDQGVQGMRVGGRRQLVIPSHLGYGDRGAGGVIAPGETLIFVCDLVGLN